MFDSECVTSSLAGIEASNFTCKSTTYYDSRHDDRDALNRGVAASARHSTMTHAGRRTGISSAGSRMCEHDSESAAHSGWKFPRKVVLFQQNNFTGLFLNILILNVNSRCSVRSLFESPCF